MNLTNEHNIPLLLAAWLLSDNYDYVDDPKYFSATTLMKPIKSTILSKRAEIADDTQDLSDYIARSLGNAVHDSVERTWTGKKLHMSLKLLGINPDAVEVNPETPSPNKTQIYVEQRAYRRLLDYTVGGKFDAVIDGIVHDIKTTSAWAWVKGTRDEDFQLQGSIYRWLNPDKVTEDYIRICFLFTDWQKGNTSTEGYPPARCAYKDIPLLSMEETEQWVSNRIKLLSSLMDEPEDKIPACTDAEVWLETPVFKYYSDPTKTDGKATKNFKSHSEAIAHLQAKGKGTIIAPVPKAKRCSEYCSAFSVCKQKDNYSH